MMSRLTIEFDSIDSAYKFLNALYAGVTFYGYKDRVYEIRSIKSFRATIEIDGEVREEVIEQKEVK